MHEIGVLCVCVFHRADPPIIRWRLNEPLTSFTYFHLQPVTWTSLGLMAVTGAGLAYYYQLEKERKQQEGKCVCMHTML